MAADALPGLVKEDYVQCATTLVSYKQLFCHAKRVLFIPRDA